VNSIELPNGIRYKIKHDLYQKNRGVPHILLIQCGNCHHDLMVYQKDGPGPLKRCYLDRIAWIFNTHLDLQQQPLTCPQCKTTIATPMIYQKENRPAIRMIKGKFTKQKYNPK